MHHYMEQECAYATVWPVLVYHTNGNADLWLIVSAMRACDA